MAIQNGRPPNFIILSERLLNWGRSAKPTIIISFSIVFFIINKVCLFYKNMLTFTKIALFRSNWRFKMAYRQIWYFLFIRQMGKQAIILYLAKYLLLYIKVLSPAKYIVFHKISVRKVIMATQNGGLPDFFLRVILCKHLNACTGGSARIVTNFSLLIWCILSYTFRKKTKSWSLGNLVTMDTHAHHFWDKMVLIFTEKHTISSKYQSITS